MRLTLRTLLAYLDNTLEPQDAELLRSKLTESGFATQLVQRIRGSLNNHALSAPSPQAVGPVEEANVISEYLDSTLTSEQVAEIERACLESEPHLAEAAACHQILTMVLGKSANVSPELRKRIYELPERQIEDLAAAGSFSSVAIPTDQSIPPLADAVPTGEAVSGLDNQPVTPVGVADSGVSDAPTRIREAVAAQGAATSVAGDKQRSRVEDARIYGGSIRPSRIAPWLVSLALAGVLLFALTRIFQPLLSPKAANVDSPNPVLTDPSETFDAADDSGNPTLAASDPSNASDGIGDPSTDSDDANADGADTGQPAAVVEIPSNDAAPAEDGTAETESTGAESTVAMPSDDDAAIITDSAPPPPPSVGSSASAGQSEPDAEDSSVSTKPPSVTETPPPVEEVMSDATDPPPAGEVVAPEEEFVAKVLNSGTLMAGQVGDQWVRLEKDAMIGVGVKIVCAPTFRGQLELEDAEVTIVGPAQVQWVSVDDTLAMRVDYGRILVTATQPETTFNVELGNQLLEFAFPDPETVAAASVKYFRAPGFDPLVPENRIPLIGLLSVQGVLSVTSDASEESLETGQQWVKRGKSDSKVSPVDAAPGWVDADDTSESSLEASARAGLLELIKGEQPLEIALREATLFRRSEVGALAARTLLHLGQGDVYFGGDGILSNPKQRAYWPDHYLSLVEAVDRSSQSAEQLRQSIVRMDSANAKPLFRLLTGYSQKQLVEGADQALVELLDSSSMSVRVMALENLHRITGTTLYFRAEQENAVRRDPMIKKWEARLRKGDIRWQE